MTKTEWTRKKRALERGENVKLGEDSEVVVFQMGCEKEYSLRSCGQTVVFTWDLKEIEEILVD